MASRNGNNVKMDFLTDDNDLRDTIVKVRRREMWNRPTESVKRQLVMTHVSLISKTFMNKQEAQRATYRAPEYNMPPIWRIGQGGHLVFPIGPKNTNMVEDIEIFLPVKFPCRPFSGFSWEVENVSANRKPGRLSYFSDRPENINFVEDVQILFPVKFRWIPFSGSRGEVENVSANQRPGRQSCCSDRPKKHKLGKRC